MIAVRGHPTRLSAADTAALLKHSIEEDYSYYMMYFFGKHKLPTGARPEPKTKCPATQAPRGQNDNRESENTQSRQPSVQKARFGVPSTPVHRYKTVRTKQAIAVGRTAEGNDAVNERGAAERTRNRKTSGADRAWPTAQIVARVIQTLDE